MVNKAWCLDRINNYNILCQKNTNFKHTPVETAKKSMNS